MARQTSLTIVDHFGFWKSHENSDSDNESYQYIHDSTYSRWYFSGPVSRCPCFWTFQYRLPGWLPPLSTTCKLVLLRLRTFNLWDWIMLQKKSAFKWPGWSPDILAPHIPANTGAVCCKKKFIVFSRKRVGGGSKGVQSFSNESSILWGRGVPRNDLNSEADLWMISHHVNGLITSHPLPYCSHLGVKKNLY